MVQWLAIAGSNPAKNARPQFGTRPETYYYGLVLLYRNALVALFPVLFVAVPEVQVPRRAIPRGRWCKVRPHVASWVNMNLPLIEDNKQQF